MTAIDPTARIPRTVRLRGMVLDWWRRLRALPLAVTILLVFGVWLTANITINAPTFALDGTWQNSLDWAYLTGKQFGTDVDFTYGPFAFLDLVSILSLRLLVPVLVASVVSAFFLAFVAWKLTRRWLQRLPAALVVTLVMLPAISAADQFSTRILILAVMCAIGFRVGAIDIRWHSSVTVVLAIVSALTVEDKFSNGTLAVGTVVLIAALCGEGAVGRRILTAVSALAVVAASIVVFWLVAGQNLAHLVPWISSSLQLTSGYDEAMATEDTTLVYQYGLLVVLGAVLVVLACLRRGSSKIILLVFVAWVLVVALRLGFTRHDLGHTAQSFTLLLIACLGVGLTRQMWLTLSVVLISAVAVLPASAVYFQFVNPLTVARTSVDAAHAVLSKGYRAVLLANAASAGQAIYGLPRPVVAAVKGKTVHIDPFDANVAWAYSLKWHPAPVFQTYAAFTPALDRINSDALRKPGGPQVVLRSTLVAIDQRNAMWETPQYMQTLVCDFTPTVSTPRWQVLSKSTNRCGHEAELSTQRFGAGQQIAVPAAPDSHYMVVAHFALDNSPLNWMATEVFKPISIVTVSTDQGDYRLPRAHAGGPLILTVPAAAGWQPQFGGSTHVTHLKVSVSGLVTFSAIRVTDGG